MLDENAQAYRQFHQITVQCAHSVSIGLLSLPHPLPLFFHLSSNDKIFVRPKISPVSSRESSCYICCSLVKFCCKFSGWYSESQREKPQTLRLTVRRFARNSKIVPLYK